MTETPVFDPKWVEKAIMSPWRLRWYRLLHFLGIRRMKFWIGVDPAIKSWGTCVEGYRTKDGRFIITNIREFQHD